MTIAKKDGRDALTHISVLERFGKYTLVRAKLETGRTHQIRCQFSSRSLPLVGDRKYSLNAEDCDIALWSYRLAFRHPKTGKLMEFTHEPPEKFPWNVV